MHIQAHYYHYQYYHGRDVPQVFQGTPLILDTPQPTQGCEKNKNTTCTL